MRQRTQELLRILVPTVATLVLGFLVVRTYLVRPWIGDREAERIETALDAAERIRAGEGQRSVEKSMGIDLRPAGGPREGPPRGWRPWTPVETPRGTVWKRYGGRWDIAAWTGRRYVALHEDIPYVPLVGWLLLVASIPGVGLSVFLSRRAARPLEEAEAVLGRMADGRLEERLDEGAGTRELRRLAGSVNRMATSLQALLARERERMAGLSHELRTPLTRIRLELELARREGGDSERLGRIEHEIEVFDAMLGEMLELARLEVGGKQLVVAETVDLAGLARYVVEEEGVPDVEVRGRGIAEVDPRLIGRLVGNLLRNSIVHAPEARRWIVVSDGAIEVGDDGPGIPADQHERVLEAFHRDGTAFGHGLGLAIVREIADLHGATVTLSEPPGLTIRVDFSAA